MFLTLKVVAISGVFYFDLIGLERGFSGDAFVAYSSFECPYVDETCFSISVVARPPEWGEGAHASSGLYLQHSACDDGFSGGVWGIPNKA